MLKALLCRTTRFKELSFVQQVWRVFNNWRNFARIHGMFTPQQEGEEPSVVPALLQRPECFIQTRFQANAGEGRSKRENEESGRVFHPEEEVQREQTV